MSSINMLSFLFFIQAFRLSLCVPTARLGDVSIFGTNSTAVESFMNIRYGQETSGHARFRRPLPFSYPKKSIVDATMPGAACPQGLGNPLPEFTGLYGNVSKISEDCLTLRVTRPLKTNENARLPVMVYLFGAGYQFGSPYDESAYAPATMVRVNAAKGLPMIYVSINYRVGIFGFAASDQLRDENNLNVGLLDQYLGLQWVQKNIAFFGGDPKSVTIFGEDSGWTNVLLQLTAFGGTEKPLFKRAALQSGPTPAGAALSEGLSANNTAQLTSVLGCSSAGNGTAELACLRALPLDTINDAQVTFARAFSPLGGSGAWRPTSPSTFIPDSVSRLLSTGRFSKGVDILIGWNENDGTDYAPEATNSTAYFVADMEYLFPGFSPPNIQTLITLYPEDDFLDYPQENVNRNFYRATQAARDAFFTCPSLQLVDAVSLYSPKSKVFMWTLNETAFAGGHAVFNRSFVKIDHFSDIPYVFDYIGTEAFYAPYATQADYNIGSLMSGSWSAFARYGQPTVPGVSNQELLAKNLTFPNWIGGKDNIRALGGPRDGMMTIDGTYNQDIPKRCGFWNREDVLAQTWN